MGGVIYEKKLALFYSYLKTKNKNNAQEKGEANVYIVEKLK
jgi:hypothetical protein